MSHKLFAMPVFSSEVPMKQWIIVRLIGYFTVTVAAALVYGASSAIYNSLSGTRSTYENVDQGHRPNPLPDKKPQPVPSQERSLVPDAPPMVERSPLPAVSKVVTPKDPSLLVGTGVFDSSSKFVGRVVSVTKAPSYEGPKSSPEQKGWAIFVVLKDDKGATHTIEYGSIEWRATPVKNEPEWGILVSAASPGR
jgi:hypothetical protein